MNRFSRHCITSLLISSAIAIGNAAPDIPVSLVSTTPAAWLNRARSMYESGNYLGAKNQLDNTESMPLTADERTEMEYLNAMCAYHTGNSNAPTLLRAFIANNPDSHLTTRAKMAIGDYYFFRTAQYGPAVKEYRELDNNALNGEMLADKLYRTAYAELMLGEYNQAHAHFARASQYPKYGEAVKFYDAYVEYAGGNYDTAYQQFSRINPDGELGQNAQYYIAQIRYHRGDYNEAASLGKKILARQNTNLQFTPEINRIVGESEYYLGNSDAATKYLDTYIAQCDTTETAPMRSAMYVKGLIAHSTGNVDEVIACMSKVTGRNDAMAQSAYLYLGQAYASQQNITSASMAFEKAMNMTYNREVQETAFYNYAVAQSIGTRTPFGSAISNFEDFLNKFPNSQYQSQVDSYLVDAYIYGNDYTKALESIERIKNPSSQVTIAKQYVLYNLGINEYSCGKTAKATTLLTQASEIGNLGNGVWQSSMLWLGDCQYSQGKYAAAEKSYKKFIAQSKRSDESYWKATYNLAYAEFQQRQYSSARENFQKAITSQSSLDTRTKADARTRIADTYYYAKNYSAAAEAYNKAISEYPEAGDYAMLRKAVVTGLQKQHSQKITILDQMLSKYPKSSLCAQAMYEKAEAQIALGNNTAATGTFESLLKKYPESAEARKGLLQLAITFRNAGNEASAIENYRKVVTKYPSSEEASLAVEDLKIIYAERDEIAKLEQFLASVPNAPKIAVSELDKLEYAAAEKAYIGEKEDISRMREYLRKHPSGAYATNARYYIATEEYNTGNYDTALSYINQVLESGSDASYAENALAMKGNILSRAGRHTEAYDTFRSLIAKATVADNRTRGQLGLMRSGYKIRKYQEVVNTAGTLLESSASALSKDEEYETRLLQADANAELGNVDRAVSGWKELSAYPRNIYGAQATVTLAQHYFNNGKNKEAEQVLNKFIDAGTPHSYWLARGFIILSDILSANGNDFEAREYLESLKSNYPGSESEIFNMIDTRLAKLKK